mgnify:CR=1 FL=1|jgi:primase-polymerase (primpol)-like protein
MQKNFDDVDDKEKTKIENNFENIPTELKEKNNWVLWKLEKKAGQEKLAKIPYQVNGMPAKANEPETWSNFQSVLETYSKGGYSGIGYEFKESDGIVGIDFDNCVKDEIISDNVESWINFFDSYTEYSQSGKGIHIICKGKKPGDKCRKDNIEIYESGRFFALTGNAFDDLTEIKECVNQIDKLYESTFGKDTTSVMESTESHLRPIASANVTDNTNAMTDNEILHKLNNAKNGAKFLALYNGDFSGYDSQSEGDLALCSMIAFYTQEKTQIERIFEGSKLNRDKWSREDYRESTISKAIESLKGTYKGMSNMNVNFELIDKQVKVENDKDDVEIRFSGVLGKSEKGYFFGFLPKEIGLEGNDVVKRFVPKSQIKANTDNSIIVPRWLARNLKEKK